jgi:hypothetical protein
MLPKLILHLPSYKAYNSEIFASDTGELLYHQEGPPFSPITSTNHSFMMMWFVTKIAAQVFNHTITRVGSREGNGLFFF